MSSPTTRTQWKHLERDPKSSYKQLSIKGRRIKARTLYGQHVNAEEPRTAEQLAADYNLPLAAVEEAIAYCRSNPPEIEEDFRREEAIMEAKGMNEPGYKFHGKPRPMSDEDRTRINREFPRASSPCAGTTSRPATCPPAASPGRSATSSPRAS